jgi:hypothetical protein
LTALKKHKDTYIEVVKEINGGQLPPDFEKQIEFEDSSAFIDPVFGSSGPTVLGEYQTKVEEQRIELERMSIQLKSIVNDNQQLIE